MDEQRVGELLALGHELRGVEFKSACNLGKNHETMKVIRAILSLANTRGGGEILLGVDDDLQALAATGSQPTSWLLGASMTSPIRWPDTPTRA